MALTTRLTHSRMETYCGCPKRFWYEYVLKLPSEPTYPAYGTLGSKAHSVLEDFYNHITIPCDPKSHFDDLIGRLYHHEFSNIVDYKRNMMTGLLNFLEMEILRYNDLENKELFIPKHNELYIKSNIAGIPFSGRIDAIYEKPDGKLIAVDYKFTSSNSIGNTQKQQATIYSILLQKELRIEFNEFEFWFLRHKNRTIKKVKITDKLIEDLNKKVYKVVDLIDNLEFDRKPSWLCRYCGYQNMCLTEEMDNK